MTTILVVDDEPDIRAALAAAIRRALPNAEILLAPDGPEGLRVLETRRVDVVLSDHRMPHMTGLDFLTRVRERAPGATRIMMTAFPDQELAVSAVNAAHIHRFFSKPFRLADVVTTLRALEAERQAKATEMRAIAQTFGSR
jgi:response regulator RpfG family c-di-GMP phosphodiesterase